MVSRTEIYCLSDNQSAYGMNTTKPTVLRLISDGTHCRHVAQTLYRVKTKLIDNEHH